MRSILVILVLAALGCFAGERSSTISMENISDKLIDSLIIDANGFLIKVYKIPPGATISERVNPDDIKGSHHIKMTPMIYSEGKSVKGAYLYNDLGGFYGNYQMTIGTGFEVKWTWTKDR